ncbi:MAG TPA: hypothetical protein P5107_05345 [Thermotogota bacterium]|nr:hypothetical protein [Thermotogota bacterium]HPF16474.1 hypothetical protein [Thermotogota bacterium]HRW34462.1 hypothetical protein [Thermotogota bacterium]
MTRELLEKIRIVEKSVGKDWIKELETCESIEELQNQVEQWRVVLTDEQAQEAYELLSKARNNELREEELINISGGRSGIK